MAVGFYGNEREEDEAGAWQSTVKQTAQGCGWDPHEVGECPRGGREQGKKQGVWGEFTRNKAASRLVIQAYP